jgi:ribosome-binding factor A
MSERKARLESLLHREIATVVQQEVRDPRLGFITIVRVEMTEDLQQAKAYYTVLGDERQRRMASQALESARAFVQTRYAPVIKSRHVPSLRFVHDDRAEQGHRMEDLIRKARATDTDAGQRPEPATEQPVPDLPGH